MVSAESCFSQNFRSSASFLNAGIDLSLLIDLALFSAHISGRYHTDQCSILPQRKS
jgi:hypothetical protein